jgi:hypothetical protein
MDYLDISKMTISEIYTLAVTSWSGASANHTKSIDFLARLIVEIKDEIYIGRFANEAVAICDTVELIGDMHASMVYQRRINSFL